MVKVIVSERQFSLEMTSDIHKEFCYLSAVTNQQLRVSTSLHICMALDSVTPLAV